VTFLVILNHNVRFGIFAKKLVVFAPLVAGLLPISKLSESPNVDNKIWRVFKVHNFQETSNKVEVSNSILNGGLIF